MTRPRPVTINGKQALLWLFIALIAVSGVIYFYVVRLKMGGTEAIRLKPAPATGAAPSQ